MGRSADGSPPGSRRCPLPYIAVSAAPTRAWASRPRWAAATPAPAPTCSVPPGSRHHRVTRASMADAGIGCAVLRRSLSVIMMGGCVTSLAAFGGCCVRVGATRLPVLRRRRLRRRASWLHAVEAEGPSGTPVVRVLCGECRVVRRLRVWRRQSRGQGEPVGSAAEPSGVSVDRLPEREELAHASRELAEAMEAARACGYRPRSRQMRTLAQAEDRLRRARQRWQTLLDAPSAPPAKAQTDVVIDLRDQRTG